jgi:aminoglycoside 6-adenylyltransferase
LDGLKERRVLLDNALDIDIIFRPKSTIGKIATDDVAVILSNGYKVIVDKIGINDILSEIKADNQTNKLPNESDFINTVNDFWYHAVWTTKKLKRGELWTAKFCLDTYMKWKLLTMIEYHTNILNGNEHNTWYSGRFIEEWAVPWIIDELSLCFSHYDKEDMKSALSSSMNLFRSVAIEVAEKLCFEYPSKSDKYATEWVNANMKI